MNKFNIEVGKYYFIRHTPGIFIVRVVSVIPPRQGHRTHWVCYKLKTKREIIIKSADKFFSQAMAGDLVRLGYQGEV